MKDKITELLMEEMYLHRDMIRMLIIQALKHKGEDELQTLLSVINLTNYKEFKEV